MQAPCCEQALCAGKTTEQNRMNYTSAWFAGWRGGNGDGRRARFDPVLGLSTCGLLLGLAASVCLYYAGTSSLENITVMRTAARPQEEIRRHFDRGTRVLGQIGRASCRERV